MQAYDPQQAVRDWLALVMARKKWTANHLALQAGISASTITRALADTGYVTSTTTLAKIAQASGVPMPGRAQPRGFAEEAVPLERDEIPRELQAGPDQTAWRLSTRALELDGYLPGDLCLTDSTIAPRPGDAVCAQVFDFERGSARTVWRRYEPPYLIARTLDPEEDVKPLLLDHERVSIVAPVTRLLRLRR